MPERLDGTVEIVAASSAGRMSLLQKNKATQLGISPLSVPNISGPEGHAERNIINRYAEKNNMKVRDIAASQPICCDCHSAIKDHGANPVSPLKKRKKMKTSEKINYTSRSNALTESDPTYKIRDFVLIQILTTSWMIHGNF